MNDFEKVLAKEIVESLTDHPELWNTSIVGIKRNDGLELSIGIFRTIYVFRPYRYEFKDDSTRIELYKIAAKLKDSIYKYKNAENEIENRNKLSEFLNLNTRKNKLEHLNEISQIEQKEEQKKESFFKRLFHF